MEFKGSKTEANLQTAFAGESQARNKYTYYAGIAKKEGYNQIANIFEETAGNEKEHATQLQAKITNGPKCTLNLPKLQEKKASITLQPCLKKLVKSKKNMKNATTLLLPTSKTTAYSNAKKNRFGFAATAAIS